MKRTLIAIACWLICSVAWGGLATDKAEYSPGDIAVLTVELEGLPEGAVLKGAAKPRITTDAVNHTLLVGPGTQIYHLAGTGGTYTVTLLAMWGLPHPEVEGAWLDFGLVDYETVVTFTGGVDPPAPPDPPPVPGGKKKVWFSLKAADKDNLPLYTHSLVFRQKLEELGHDYQETVTASIINSPPARLSKVAQAVREAGIPYPVVVLEPINGGSFVVAPLPATADEMLEVLK